MKNKGTEMVITHSFIVQMSKAVIVRQYCKPLKCMISIVRLIIVLRSKYTCVFK